MAAKSSSQVIIQVHSKRIEPQENSYLSGIQTVPGVLLFFIFVSFMITVALAETAAIHSPLSTNNTATTHVADTL